MSRRSDFAGPIVATVTATTGVGATQFFEAEDDCVVADVVFNAAGSNAAATVARIFLNNGDDPAVAKNNALIADVTLPVTVLSQSSALTATVLALDWPMRKGQRLMCALGAGASPGWYVAAKVEPPELVV